MKSIRFQKLLIDHNLYQQIKLEIAERSHSWDNTALYYDLYNLQTSPLLLKYIKDLGILEYVRSVGHTVIKPLEEIPVHVDNYDTYIWSLTIPFKNPEGTYNRFFKDEGRLPLIKADRDYGPYAVNQGWVHPEPNKAVWIDQVEVDGPMLLNTGVPHSVVNLSDCTREALVIRLNEKFTPDVIELSKIKD